MSDRIDEYHGADAKPWTTKEVEKWQFVLGPTMPLRRSLATARALEDAERKRDEFKVASQEKAGWLLDALALASASRRERDEARARVTELERDLSVATHDLDELVDVEIDHAAVERERDEARATVAELVAALEGLFVEYDYLCSEGSKYALRLGRVPDHACAECVPGGPMVEPRFRCREHAARAALAKAKEAKS